MKYKVATQMGNQGFSHECNRVAAEIVWSGAIGDVTEAHISTTPGTHPTGLQAAAARRRPCPATLDWDLWLGARRHAALSALTTRPTTGAASWISAPGRSATGPPTPRVPVHTALQLGAPTSVECVSRSARARSLIPTAASCGWISRRAASMPPVKVYYHDPRASERSRCVSRARHGERDDSAARPTISPTRAVPSAARPAAGTRRPRRSAAPRRGRRRERPATRRDRAPAAPACSVFGEPLGPAKPGILTGNGSVFIGTKGIMATCDRGEGVWLLPASRWQEYVLPPQLLTRSPGPHARIGCAPARAAIRGCSDFSITGALRRVAGAGAIAFRVPGKLEWDSKNLRFTNSREANKYVKPHMPQGLGTDEDSDELYAT